MPVKAELSRLGAKAFAILEKVPVFYGLSAQERESLVRHCHTLRYSAGETLVGEGESSDALLVLLSGVVEVGNGARGFIRRMQPGETIGELGLLCQIKRTATVTAASECCALQIDRTTMSSLLGVAPRIYAIIMKNIAAGLAERVISLTARPAD